MDIHLAYAEGLKIYGDDGELTGPDYLREALDDDEAWRQEYECEFVDESTSFIPYELIGAAESQTLTDDNPWQGNPVHAGIDIGRKKDRTVYWSFELIGDVFWSLKILMFQGVSFHDQLNGLLAQIDLDKPRRICVDSTGIGAMLAETLQKVLGAARVEQVQFRNSVKEDLAVHTKTIFEDRRVRIPVDRTIREDIHNIRKTVTSAGNVRFDAERTKDGHSDHFWALALALHAGSRVIQELDIMVAQPREVMTALRNFATVIPINLY